MENGRRINKPEPLEASRARCKAELNGLSDELLRLTKADPGYVVEWSPGLAKLHSRLTAEKNP
jgi:hypothetical protein